MSRWCVKVRRYTGGESVINIYDTKPEADQIAERMNDGYQSDRYYVEEWREQG